MAGRFPPDGSYPLLHAIEDENGNLIAYDYDEEEEDEDDDEDSASEDEEDGDTNDDEPEAVVPPPPPPPPRVSPSRPATLSEDSEVSPRTRGGGETTTSSLSQDSSGLEWSRSEIDGLFCPICMEAWTSGGDHQVCCLPCGHLYGASCIKKWLQQRKNSGKCPQCNRKSTLKDVRVIYAQQIVAIDQEIQKKVRSLEAKCASLEEKNNDWQKRECKWQEREAALDLQVHQLREASSILFIGLPFQMSCISRKSYLERLLGDAQNRPSGLLNAHEGCTEQAMFGRNLDLKYCGQGSSSNFILQKELQVDGAKLFDVDASSQIGIIAQRLSGMGGMHVLAKMSLIAPHGRENIVLPVNTKAVRDLRVAPHGRLALLASLGKKLSIISMESNNTVLSYDLPAAAWSCSWDLNSSHYVYTGLQVNGMLLVFDMRQTLKPVESVVGLTSNPIHTMYSLLPDSTLPSGVRSLLTASSGGLCQWNFGAIEERTFLIPGSENQGVCIALAYCPSSNHIVASFRPKIEMSNDTVVSQPSLSPVSSMGKGVRGTHVLYKALGNSCYQKLGSTCASVNEVRLPKSAIIYNQNLQFASTNEVTCEVVLQELPSFMAVQHLKSQTHPIRDVKYTHDLSSGLLSCLSEDRLQLFSRKTL
ncbi:hypothetical protein RHGRI_007178 [Rhododendron griersonianum]|uniref:RING-type E3 ubiquitin transferase n=1 Tax=Rhododendron griersonianum TaxID=479676 RepID=A0AAV6KX45_9ERIC|nr:hypothetical protein RHGRI_007178 [Rhododendron griersonianum]